MRIAIGFSLLGVVGLVVYLNRDDLAPAVDALKHTHPGWMVLAGGLLLLSIANITALHWACRRAVGMSPPRDFVRLVPVATASNGLNSIIRSGSVAGLPLFVEDARQRGQPTGTASAAYLLSSVLVNLAFGIPLLTAVAVATTFHELSVADYVAIGICLVFILSMAALVAAAIYDKNLLLRIYVAPIRLTNALRRKPRDTVINTKPAEDVHAAISLARSHPRQTLFAFLCAVGVDHIGVAILWASLAAVGGSDKVLVALVAYVLSTAFAAVAIIPGGLGVAELGGASALIAFGTPSGVAGAAIIIFRLWNFWLPVLIGICLAFVLHRRAATQAA